MSAGRVVLTTLDLGELLVIVRSASALSGGPGVVTTADGERAVLDRLVAGATGRTVLLDDRIRGELGVLVRSVSATSVRVPPVLVFHGDVGSSAALRRLLSELPDLLQATVVVSYNHAAWARRLTLSVLRRSSVLPVEEIRGRTDLHPGVVYLAPPLGRAARLQVQAGVLVAVEEPVPPTTRAAANRLLTTAAQASSTVVVLLDGIAPAPVAGLRAVRVAGGRIVPGADAARSATVRQADDAGLLDGAPAVSALPGLLGDLAHGRSELTP